MIAAAEKTLKKTSKTNLVAAATRFKKILKLIELRLEISSEIKLYKIFLDNEFRKDLYNEIAKMIPQTRLIIFCNLIIETKSSCLNDIVKIKTDKDGYFDFEKCYIELGEVAVNRFIVEMIISQYLTLLVTDEKKLKEKKNENRPVE